MANSYGGVGVGIAINTVANASGGNTVYTIVGDAAAAANGYLNFIFVVTGCAASANNGTFTCTASDSTHVTLNNASGTSASSQVGVGISQYYIGTNSPTSQYTGKIIGVATAFGSPAYQGLTWMLGVFVLPRDTWAPPTSTPYAGQTYPTPNTGGATTGQTYPY